MKLFVETDRAWITVMARDLAIKASVNALMAIMGTIAKELVSLVAKPVTDLKLLIV